MSTNTQVHGVGSINCSSRSFHISRPSLFYPRLVHTSPRQGFPSLSMKVSRATVFISICCATTSTAARVTKRESLLRHRSLQAGGPPGGGPPDGGGGGGPGGTTCSTNLSPNFGNPSQGRCAEVTQGTSYLYPEVIPLHRIDFFGAFFQRSHI